ncbi:MAG: hypothetical protein OEM96_07775 [Gemmatimonadota bacterium]|nr:hypothetical protein [Gemmatimonadota bacterium]
MKSLRNPRNVFVLAVAFGSLTSCTPRQAIVASDPPTRGARTGVGDGPLIHDLQRVYHAQASFLEANGIYADQLASLNVTPTEGVRIDIIQGDRNGFSAIARSGDFECAVYEGNVRAPRTYLTAVSEVGCRP